MEYENGLGVSFQGGLDYNVNDKWFINLDVKKLLLSTDVKVDICEEILPVAVDIDPLIVALGACFRFN